MNLLEKYTDSLQSIPSPGGGGCHSALLGVANLGIMAGLTDGQIFADVRNSIPHGGRNVPDTEIMAAIKRGRLDTQPLEEGAENKAAPIPPKPQPTIQPAYLQRLIAKGAGFSEVDFWEASPIRLYDEPDQDALFLLDTLYRPEDVVFMGERYDTAVQTADTWKQHIEQAGTACLPHIIPNPVTGKQHPDKTGNPSFRCDAAIKDFRFAVVEFDNLNRADQLAFWAAIPLPIAALIDTGGKSIHGWIKVDGIRSNEEWEKQIETELYARRLIPLGVDPVCRTEARLSRLPGHFRKEKGNWQKLLYLNPTPRIEPIIEAGRC